MTTPADKITVSGWKLVNPLIPAASAFAVGIFLAHAAYCLPRSGTSIAAVFFSGLLLILHFLRQGRKASFVLPVLFFLLGNLHAEPVSPPKSPHHIFNLLTGREEGSLYGVLLQSPDSSIDKTRFVLVVKEIIWPTGEAVTATGLVQLSMKERLSASYTPGDALLVRATISPARGLANPGCFDYQEFLRQKAIWVTGWVDSPLHLMKVHDPTLITPWHAIMFSPEKMRHRIRLFIDNAPLDLNHKALYKAILIGDYGDLGQETIDVFKISGAFHLLSISGLHMSLIAMTLFYVIMWILKRHTELLLRFNAKKIASVLTAVPLVCYAFIAGFQPPVARALLMTLMIFGSVLLDRTRSAVNAVAMAAFIILLYAPESIMQASFQLSFAAIIAMVAVLPELNSFFAKTPASEKPDHHISLRTIGRRLLGGLLVSLVAMVGTAPLTLLHFNFFSPLSPLSTLLAEPFLCLWALISGLLASVIQVFSPDLGFFLLKLGSLGLDATQAILKFLAALPGSSLWLPAPNGWELAAYYLFFFCLIHARKRPSYRLAAVAPFLFLVLEPLIYYVTARERDQSAVTFLDVGQGSAAVLQMAHGDAILIDGGGPATPHFNVGETVIAPYLWNNRHILGLKSVVLTHPHDDHYNGLAPILRRFRPETLFIPRHTQTNQDFLQLLTLAQSLGIATLHPQAGQTLYENVSGDKLICLASEKGETLHEKEKPLRGKNEQMGLVLRFDIPAGSFLFSGDIGAGDEQRLTEMDAPLHADVLAVPHHGSVTSSSDIFLDKVSPRYGILSAGKSSLRPFPARKTVERYDTHGIKLYNTAIHGAITVTSASGSLVVEPYQNPTATVVNEGE